MEITAIKTYAVKVGIRNQLLVKIETDEGIFGWGESGLSGREKAVVGALEHYAEFLRGRDPFKIGSLWQKCIAASIRRWARPSGRRFRHRYRASRYQGQGARRAVYDLLAANSAIISQPSPQPLPHPP